MQLSDRFYQHLDEILDGWIILADKGHVGAYKELNCIAAVLKENQKERKLYSKEYWRKLNIARSDVERTFAGFFYNKSTQLGRWPGKSEATFVEFSANVIFVPSLSTTILRYILDQPRFQFQF